MAVHSPEAASNQLLSTPSFRFRGLELAEPSEAGGKGAGLLRLSPEWYPPTLILTPAVHVLYKSGQLSSLFLTDSRGAATYKRALKKLAETGHSRKLFIRSSARAEGMGERGRYESVSAELPMASIEAQILRLWNGLSDPDADLGFVIQPWIDAHVSGHLSNEYRVSRDATAWTSEMQVGSQTSTRPWRVISSAPADDGPLYARSVKDLERVLRSIARRLSDMPSRHHLEWIWDGERVWVVQADRVPPRKGPAPGDAWQPTVGRPVDPQDLSVWRLLDDDSLRSATRWTKTSALSAFSKAQLPFAQVWMLSGGAVIQDIAEGRQVTGLDEDLNLICSGHVVVRTDVDGSFQDVMWPKTGTIAEPRKVRAFLKKTSAALIKSGVTSDNICFLIHRFVRARACAWSLASPGDPYVAIDSMWGTPDGLSWLPHDRSRVNVDTSEVRRSIEGKPAFLDVDASNSWTYRDSPDEWIWRASLTEDQARFVAAGAARLAAAAGESVLTMWLIGVLDGPEVECLPWFQMKKGASDQSRVGQVSPASPRIEIRTLEDLDAAESLAIDAPTVLRLLPNPNLVRDKRFIDRVVSLALPRNLTVEIVGSPLAHPYYLLQEAGVAVSCVGQFGQPSRPFNKLVRDNIVDLIESNGESVVSYQVTGIERAKLLRLKIVEEAIELLRTDTAEDAADEIADVEEVLDSLRATLGITKGAVRERRKAKNAKRGGFSEGRVLVSTGMRSAPPPGELEGIEFTRQSERPWQVQERSDRVLVSLVPPVPGEQQVYLLKIGSTIVRLEYQSSTIEIREGAKSAAAPRRSDPTLFE